MKKFSENILEDKTVSLDFNKDKPKDISNDIENLNDQLNKEIEGTKLEGSWEIVSVVDVSMELPNIKEALIINAELGTQEIKRGEYIYITAQIKKKGQSVAYHPSQMGVIKTRITDIYNTMAILNTLK